VLKCVGLICAPPAGKAPEDPLVCHLAAYFVGLKSRWPIFLVWLVQVKTMT